MNVRVPAQNRPGPMHELSEGCFGGVVVHAKHAMRTKVLEEVGVQLLLCDFKHLGLLIYSRT